MRGRDVVVVVGGGITGLAAALELTLDERTEIIVIESQARWGGKIRTENIAGIAIDTGPDSFLARDPWGRDLCESVGLGDELIAPAVFGAAIWTGRRLRRLPAGFAYGMPASPLAALRSGILTPRGALRAAADLVLPGPLRGPDVSIGEFVRARFGAQVLDRLVDPLLAGTRAGVADELSLAAATPQIDRLARTHRSLILGLRTARRAGLLERGAPPFLRPRGGLERLVDAAVETLRGRGVTLRAGARVERIERAKGYRVALAGGESIDADGVVVAVPSYVAAHLLRGLAPEAARALDSIVHASVATVTLVYPPDSLVPPVSTSGLLVPSGARTTLAAATWYSSKWPESAPADGRQVVKAVAGRAADDRVLDADDDELGRRVASDHARMTSLERAPLLAHVRRFDRALPQYEVGHEAKIQAIDRGLRTHEGLQVASSGQSGAGISDAIKRGRDAARSVLASLTSADRVDAINEHGKVKR